eukprot:1630573-Alexandrium_andersonii.AAC.1
MQRGDRRHERIDGESAQAWRASQGIGEAAARARRVLYALRRQGSESRGPGLDEGWNGRRRHSG